MKSNEKMKVTKRKWKGYERKRKSERNEEEWKGKSAWIKQERIKSKIICNKAI